MNAEQLALPLEGYGQSTMAGDTGPAVQKAGPLLHISRPQSRTVAHAPKFEMKLPMPTPNVDCRCNLYETGQQWCKWFESGDCREA